MKLSRASVYAIHAVVHLARTGTVSALAKPLSAKAIATATGIPPVFAGRILNQLARSRIVLAVRGPHGGYVLGTVPEQVSMLDVVQAVDGPIYASVRDDDNELAQALLASCGAIAFVVRERLGKVTVAELAKE